MGPEIKQQQIQLQGGKFKSRLCDARASAGNTATWKTQIAVQKQQKNSKQNFDNLHHTTHLTTLLTTNLLASPQNLFNLFCCKKGDLVALNLHYAATDRTYLFTTSSGDIGLLKR